MSNPPRTLDDICTRYHVSDRRAREIVHQNNVPILKPGREWLFDDAAERAFVEASRLCPSKSSGGKGRKSGGFRGQSKGDGFAKALELLT